MSFHRVAPSLQCNPMRAYEVIVWDIKFSARKTEWKIFKRIHALVHAIQHWARHRTPNSVCNWKFWHTKNCLERHPLGWLNGYLTYRYCSWSELHTFFYQHPRNNYYLVRSTKRWFVLDVCEYYHDLAPHENVSSAITSMVSAVANSNYDLILWNYEINDGFRNQLESFSLNYFKWNPLVKISEKLNEFF